MRDSTTAKNVYIFYQTFYVWSFQEWKSMWAAFRLHGVTEIRGNRVKQSSEHESFQMFRFPSAERTTWNEYFANCVMDNPIICTLICRLWTAFLLLSWWWWRHNRWYKQIKLLFPCCNSFGRPWLFAGARFNLVFQLKEIISRIKLIKH